MKGVAQYNLGKLYGYQISSVCEIMTNTSAPGASSDLDRLAVVFSTINTGLNGSCLDASYQNMVKFLSNATVDEAQASRQWTFQTCNEVLHTDTTHTYPPYPLWVRVGLTSGVVLCFVQFGYFQACDVDELCMFSPLETVQYYTDLCAAVFGIDAATTSNRVCSASLCPSMNLASPDITDSNSLTV